MRAHMVLMNVCCGNMIQLEYNLDMIKQRITCEQAVDVLHAQALLLTFFYNMVAISKQVHRCALRWTKPHIAFTLQLSTLLNKLSTQPFNANICERLQTHWLRCCS